MAPAPSRAVCLLHSQLSGEEAYGRGGGTGASISSLSLKTGKSRGPRKRGAGRDQRSLAPLPHLADEETDSAAVSALLGGMGQVCAERGWTGQNPSLEDKLPHLSQAAWGHGQTASLGTGHLGPDSNSATHRVTLDKSCPSLGSSCSSSVMRGLD